jgi:hypothetical protein
VAGLAVGREVQDRLGVLVLHPLEADPVHRRDVELHLPARVRVHRTTGPSDHVGEQGDAD